MNNADGQHSGELCPGTALRGATAYAATQNRRGRAESRGIRNSDRLGEANGGQGR